MSAFVQRKAFSDWGPSLSVYLIECFHCHLLSKALNTFIEDVCVNKSLTMKPFILKGKGEITYHVLQKYKRKDPQVCRLLQPAPEHSVFHWCLVNFVVRPLGFILPGETCWGGKTSLLVCWCSLTPLFYDEEVVVWLWTLELVWKKWHRNNKYLLLLWLLDSEDSLHVHKPGCWGSL